jgi:hypothetical protein
MTAGPPMPDTGSSVTSAQQGDPTDDLRHAIMFVQTYMEQEQDVQDLVVRKYGRAGEVAERLDRRRNAY